MDPPADPPPPDPNPWDETPSELPPDVPRRWITCRPSFPEPDPIRAVPGSYLPSKEQTNSYSSQLRDGLQTLVQGPLDYRLTGFMSSWNELGLGVPRGDFEAAARLTIAVLDAGPQVSDKTLTPLGAGDWGTLASACLAAIARGFTRPLTEISRKNYNAFWEGMEDIPQHTIEEGENPEFHSLLQRLKATNQHLDIHINADEKEGLRKWTLATRKEVEEAATRSATAEAEIALYNWKVDQLTMKQQQLEETLKRTILERNMDLFRDTASALGLEIGDLTTALPSRPTPLTGNKRTASGSAPQPARAAKSTPLPSVPVVTPPQVPTMDVITLTAAVQTAMQPFVLRLAAIESSTAAKNTKVTGASNAQPNLAQAAERASLASRPPAPDRIGVALEQTVPDGEWAQVTSKRKRGTKGKPEQANPPLQQVNLTPRSYAAAATAPASSNQQLAQSQSTQPANPMPPAFTEVTVVRRGGSIMATKEKAVRLRQPDAIVREVRANMAREVAKPLPIVSGRWSSGARSKGNFVFTMRGQVDFAFVQTFEHFLVGPFPGGGQLCPNQGWTKLLAHGVPVADNDGTVFGPEDLEQEVRAMEGLRKVYFSSPPRWMRPVGDLTSAYSSLTFAFSDPDGSVTKQLFKNRQALFGKHVQIERWVDKPLLIQCGRCHALGHAASSKSCRLPKDSVKCYICGKGHLTDNHDRECQKSKQHKVAGRCDCRLQCITCNKVGHHARDRACPAREGYRSRRSRPVNKGKGKERDLSDLAPEVTTQRPDSPFIPQYARAEDDPDEEMRDEVADLGNFIPQNFLPGPGLSREEAFSRMEASAEETLKKLSISIPAQLEMTPEDRERENTESNRRLQIDKRVSPAEAGEAERYDLAEAVTRLPQGYFYPEMPEARRRQLAAIISAGTPQIVNHNTPGIASTSTARILC
jgi:hypothetical protein